MCPAHRSSGSRPQTPAFDAVSSRGGLQLQSTPRGRASCHVLSLNYAVVGRASLSSVDSQYITCPSEEHIRIAIGSWHLHFGQHKTLSGHRWGSSRLTCSVVHLVEATESTAHHHPRAPMGKLTSDIHVFTTTPVLDLVHPLPPLGSWAFTHEGC